MRAHLSPILATSPFPAAPTRAANARPVVSRTTLPYRAHGSEPILLTIPGTSFLVPTMFPSTTGREIVRSRTAPGAADTQ
jgi:hypothetical protein